MQVRIGSANNQNGGFKIKISRIVIHVIYLRKVSLPIVNRTECLNAYSNETINYPIVTSRMICAGYEQGAKGGKHVFLNLVLHYMK